MAGLLLKLRTWWETADRTQKAVTLFGGVFLVALLLGTFYFASKPKMTMAFGGLSPTDVGSVSTEIQKLGIPVEYDLQGNVLVPSEKVAEVHAKLALAGKLPSTGHIGNEELANFSLMTPPSVESARLKNVMEGELARSIELIEGVGAARVHLTEGDRSPFAAESKPPSASIFITEKVGGGISTESARAIAMMVTNAVTGLDPSKVFVLDNAGRSLYVGSDANSDYGVAGQKIQAERAEAMRREKDLQAKLDAVIGRGNSFVTVNLEMDFDKHAAETDKKGKPIVSESVTEVFQKGGGALQTGGGTAGTAPNDANATPSTGGKDEAPRYEKTATAYQPTDTVTRESEEKAIGSIKNMAIAVMINKTKVQDPTPVEEFLKGYTGENAQYKYSVTSLEFDKTAEEEAKKTVSANSGRETMQQVMSLLPIIALLVVGFLVMKSIAKAAKSQTVMVHAMPDGTMVAGLPGGGHSHGHVSGGGGAEVDAVEEAVQALSHRNLEDVGEIETRMNKPLEQIKRMAQDRPESVALLIKSWLLEERR